MFTTVPNFRFCCHT